ncbi:MAG: VCBS repeat-containing protein [Geminicoccaceae bacterium]
MQTDKWKYYSITVAGFFFMLVLGAPPGRAEPLAVEATAAAGLSYGRGTQGQSAVVDLDGDGDYDLVPSRHGTAPWPIMRNNGDGTFTEISRGVLVKDDRHGCIAGDFGSLGGGGRPDGRPDLYCVEGACRGNKSCGKENDLVFQQPGGNFSTNQAKQRGVADIHGRGREAVALDFDRDGLLDIAVANFGPSVYPTPNRLFHNTGGGKFKTITDTPVNAEMTSSCVAAGDLDGDGWPELMFCAGQSGDPIRTLTYKNVKGTFQDQTAKSPYRKVKARSIKITDLARDGRQDLIIVEQKRLRIWLNGKKGLPSTPSYVRAISEGRDVAVGDINGDGKLDLYLCTGWKSGASQAPEEMLVNNGNSRSFHTVRIPQVTAGDGDAVASIPDWLGSGLAAFMVGNGKSGSKHGPGPAQLITFLGS